MPIQGRCGAVGDADVELMWSRRRCRYRADVEPSAMPMYIRCGAVGDGDLEPIWSGRRAAMPMWGRCGAVSDADVGPMLSRRRCRCGADVEPSAILQVDSLIAQLDEEQRRRANMGTAVRSRRSFFKSILRLHLGYIQQEEHRRVAMDAVVRLMANTARGQHYLWPNTAHGEQYSCPATTMARTTYLI